MREGPQTILPSVIPGNWMIRWLCHPSLLTKSIAAFVLAGNLERWWENTSGYAALCCCRTEWFVIRMICNKCACSPSAFLCFSIRQVYLHF